MKKPRFFTPDFQYYPKKGVPGVLGVPEIVSNCKQACYREHLQIKIITKRCSREKSGTSLNKSIRACVRKTFNTTTCSSSILGSSFSNNTKYFKQTNKGVQNEPTN